MASNLVDTLTASGGTESAGFLNDIVAQLWPNIAVAGSKILKDSVEPVLASTLPGPLANLKFVKLDLGTTPIHLERVDVHKTTKEGIKLDMDVVWDGVCDIELDGSGVPKIGIEKVKLRGRLSILLCPLTNVIPLIGAAQVAFINPPDLELDFTDAANIADCFLISKTVRSTIIGIINSMAVLPNRFLVKLDSNNDYFKAYQPHLGLIRLTVVRASGISAPKNEKKSGVSRLIGKIIKDVPDCYVKVNVGAEEEWRTSVQKNDHDPTWNETHDFLVADFEQHITVDIQDDDLVGDDDIGIGHTTIKDILLNGGNHEFQLTHKGEQTTSKLVVQAKFYNFVGESQSLGAAQEHDASSIGGLMTILIAGVQGLQGQREDLNPSVQVTLGDKKFVTAVKTYTPGTDIFNPSFDQAFRIPLTAEMLSSQSPLRLSLMNKQAEAGGVDIPFQDIVGAPEMIKEGTFEVGSGAVIRANISVHGIKLAE